MIVTENRSESPPAPAYERLRTRALNPCGPREMGYGLLVQRGILAWMRTAAACAPVKQQGSSAMPLPVPLDSELVRTIVSLIVDSQAVRSSFTPSIR
ncbi:MAG: hypothetical protein QGD90_11145 [Candidatus Hydrogenedentes bacterium]|nr:hypothetical protein [Candidatus Hydrogenedentota bacterium]